MGLQAPTPTQGENKRELLQGPLTPTMCHGSPGAHPGLSTSKLGDLGPRKAPVSLGAVTVAKGSTLVHSASLGLGPTMCH